MIREMKEADALFVAEIYMKSLGYLDVSEDTVRLRIQQLSDDSHYFNRVYVTDDRKVTGFIQAEEYTHLYGDRGWNVIALAVDPDVQNMGCGKALLKALEEYASMNGQTFIRLNSGVHRTQAHAFYEHLGYINDKTQKHFTKYL